MGFYGNSAYLKFNLIGGPIAGAPGSNSRVAEGTLLSFGFLGQNNPANAQSGQFSIRCCFFARQHTH